VAQAIFGLQVEVRVRTCRADYVAHAVEQAQHMDRIPLCDKAPGKTEVDLLIPLEPTDLKATYTRSYGWSAFVRRREDHRDLVGQVGDDLANATTTMEVVASAGVAKTPQRQPLAAARANLFVMPTPSQSKVMVQLNATYVAVAKPSEFIVLVLGPQQAQETQPTGGTVTKPGNDPAIK
jgi:hypothetical protein